MKSPNLRRRQACSQNKGLSRSSWLQTSPSPIKDRQREQPELEGAITAPEMHPVPNCKQTLLLTKTSWDLGWSTSTGRVAARDQFPRRDTRHRCAGCTPRKLSSSDGRGDTLEPSIVDESAHQAPGLLSCSDLGRTQNAGSTESAPLWSTQVLEP